MFCFVTTRVLYDIFARSERVLIFTLKKHRFVEKGCSLKYVGPESLTPLLWRGFDCRRSHVHTSVLTPISLSQALDVTPRVLFLKWKFSKTWNRNDTEITFSSGFRHGRSTEQSKIQFSNLQGDKSLRKYFGILIVPICMSQFPLRHVPVQNRKSTVETARRGVPEFSNLVTSRYCCSWKPKLSTELKNQLQATKSVWKVYI